MALETQLDKKYFKSVDVKVFPCSFRGNQDNFAFDPESRLPTEFNLIHTGNGRQSYLLDYVKANAESDTGTLKFVLGGYYFEVANIKAADLVDKSFYIYLRPALLAETEDEHSPYAELSTEVLESFEYVDVEDVTDHTLDIRKSGDTNYYFTGLYYGDRTGTADEPFSFYLTPFKSTSIDEEKNPDGLNCAAFQPIIHTGNGISEGSGNEHKVNSIRFGITELENGVANDQNTADGTGSFAHGKLTAADGAYSHAEGKGEILDGATKKVTASGTASHAEGFATTASDDYAHAEGYKTLASSDEAHSEGNQTTASGIASHAEGELTKASGTNAHAEGDKTQATANNSHAEGIGNGLENDSEHPDQARGIAAGTGAHSEGYYTKANGQYSHAEGQETSATGMGAHAEGYKTLAHGDWSHAEGKDTEANVSYSHVGGIGTRTSNTPGQTVFGNYNIETVGQFIIGAGEAPTSVTEDEETITTRHDKNVLIVNGEDTTIRSKLHITNDGSANYCNITKDQTDLESAKIYLKTPNNEHIDIISGDTPTIKICLHKDGANTKGKLILKETTTAGVKETAAELNAKKIDLKGNAINLTPTSGTATSVVITGTLRTTNNLQVSDNTNKSGMDVYGPSTLNGTANIKEKLTCDGGIELAGYDYTTGNIIKYNSYNDNANGYIYVDDDSALALTKHTVTLGYGAAAYHPAGSTTNIQATKLVNISALNNITDHNSALNISWSNTGLVEDFTKVKGASSTKSFLKARTKDASDKEETFELYRDNTDGISTTVFKTASTNSSNKLPIKFVSGSNTFWVFNNDETPKTETDKLVVNDQLTVKNSVIIWDGESGKYISMTPDGISFSFGQYGNFSIDSDGIDTNAPFVSYNTISTTATITAKTFFANSDAVLKENITPFKSTKSILDLPIYSYNFINEDESQIGCLAQDLQKLYPELVSKDAHGFLAIQENKLVYLLLDEVKKLKEEIKSLKK